MTVKDILSRIEYTVIIDEVEYSNRDITFSTWMETMIKQSEKASGYTPAKMFDPVARDNFQKFFAVAYYAGLIPAKVVETRTAEIGADGCYIFTVETVGTLDPENDSTDSTDSTDSQPAARAKFAGMYELAPVNGQKSFHGKAVVEVYQDGSAILFSYNTPIIKRALNGDLTRLYAGWNQTTEKHIKAFCGLDKAGFMALPHDTTPAEEKETDKTADYPSGLFTIFHSEITTEAATETATYDYKEAVLKDIREYIKEEINLDEWKENRDGLESKLNDDLWTVDSVTGNASGSYTFSTWQAEKNLCHNWDLLEEALDEFGGDTDILRQGPEACDVTIRCYLLGQAIAEALDELEEDGAFDESEESTD